MTTLAAPKSWNLGAANDFLMETIGFVPTGREQAEVLRCRKKFKLIVGGAQAGKSIVSSADFILHLYEDRVRFPGEPLLYWLVAADYDRTKREFEYISEFLPRLNYHVDASKRVDPGSIDVWYHKDDQAAEKKPIIRIETKSGKDPRTLAMSAPHGIIGCEASQLDLDTYQRCVARLAPKKGWLTLGGTFEKSLGWYPGLAKAWEFGSEHEQSFRIPSTSNFHFYPLGEDDEALKEIRKTHSDDFYLEHIMGIAAPPAGGVFQRNFRADIHIRPLAYDPSIDKVFIWDDPGYGHAHAIEVAQIVNGQIRVFYEYYQRGLTTEEMIEHIMKEPWWKAPGKTLVIDPNYANQHHGTHSVAEIWSAKTGLQTQGQKVKIYDGIERLKGRLKPDPVSGEPGIVFNGALGADGKPVCKGVLSEFGAYPNPFDGQTKIYSYKQDNEGNVIGDEPEDKYNDGIKACFDPRTEILTGNGWRFFPDLPKGERVATRRSDGTLEYQTPVAYIDEPYKGLMASHIGKNVNFLLTPNHNLFVANQYSVYAHKQYATTAVSGPQFTLTTPLALPGRSWLGRTAKWDGEDAVWTIRHKRHGTVRIPMEPMARFYGLWLAEGSKSKATHANKYCLYIDQKNHVAEVRAIVAALGLPFYTQVSRRDGTTRFTVSCKELHALFAKQGRSWEKRVPRVFLNGTPAALRALIEGYLLGDGSRDRDTGHQSATSTSKGLLDDMQEAAFKAGIASNVYDYSFLRPNPKHHGLFNLSLISENDDAYSLTGRGLTTLKKEDVDFVPYDGRVYCVTVPNGVIAVRRNGKVMWAGNCTYGIVAEFGLVQSEGSEYATMVRRRPDGSSVVIGR